jgi:diguanylate cyclase (GGDEF)-like protein/PAS domain S-box-containing protein
VTLDPLNALLVVRGTVVTGANARALDELGTTAGELVGADLTLLVEDDGDRDRLARLLAAPDLTAVSVGLTIGGERRHVELRARAATPAEASGEDGGDVVVAVRDRSEVHLLHAIIDAIADTTLLLDEAGLVRWQSRSVSEQVPGGPEAGIGVNPLERIHPEDLPGVLEASARGLAAPGTRVRHVARSRAVDDDDAWQLIEMVGTNASDDPDVAAFVVQVRDLGEAEAVESLADTGGQFLSLAEAAPMGIVVSDLVGRTIYRNAAAKELLAQPELRPERDWRELADDDHRAGLDALFAEVVATREPGSITAAFMVEGRTCWLRVHLAPRVTVDEGNLYVIATLEDVTTEIEAREATDRLTHMLDATTDFVAVFVPGGEILYVNAATRRQLDALREDGAPGELRDLIDDEPRRAWIAAAMAELETTDVWQGELQLNAGGGRVIPISAMGVIRRSPDGDLDWIAIHGRDITDLKAAENLLREMASHDHLTGLANRALFNERLDRAVARHRRDATGVAVMFCDLDGFKAINDEHGHAAGDLVLSVIADRLRLVTRETDTTARVGGDEFVIVCEGVTDLLELRQLAQRVIDAVTGPITLPEVGRTARPPQRIRVGISIGIGVAGADQTDVDPDRLLTLADTAMYRAKAAGGTTAIIDRLD